MQASIAQPSHSQPHFLGRHKQEHYLRYFTKLDADAEKVLEDIYQLAQHRQTQGSHVITAMAGAMKHPAIRPLVLQNIAIRLWIKLGERLQSDQKRQQLEEVLEDFHVALDAFMGKISLDEAERLRETKAHDPTHAMTPQEKAERRDEQMEAALKFREQTKPVIDNIKAKNRKK